MALSVVVVFLVVAIPLGYPNLRACDQWRDRHLRIQIAEIFKNSPVILTEERIRAEIGELPWSCTTPRPTEADIARFRQELTE